MNRRLTRTRFPAFAAVALAAMSAMAGCASTRDYHTGHRLSDAERFWLSNAIIDHGFDADEAALATGLRVDAVEQAVREGVVRATAAERASGNCRVLPYPGGRHPRIGFLDGAVNPMRGTKASIFAPWDPRAYVVVDVPEAIFSNLGLLFLAHTHIPTIWDEQGIVLADMDWTRHRDGGLSFTRTLPNKVSFGAEVRPTRAGAAMRLWLRNGSGTPLTGLRTQVCIMLKGMPCFTGQTLENKTFDATVAVARADDGSGRYIVTAWEHTGRAWGNAHVPCIHADPVLPDCAPGHTVEARGEVCFGSGTDLEDTIGRLKARYARR